MSGTAVRPGVARIPEALILGAGGPAGRRLLHVPRGARPPQPRRVLPRAGSPGRRGLPGVDGGRARDREPVRALPRARHFFRRRHLPRRPRPGSSRRGLSGHDAHEPRPPRERGGHGRHRRGPASPASSSTRRSRTPGSASSSTPARTPRSGNDRDPRLRHHRGPLRHHEGQRPRPDGGARGRPRDPHGRPRAQVLRGIRPSRACSSAPRARWA
jgi:hypothetical protein